MALWFRKKRNLSGESPEESLARLQAAPHTSQFRLTRGGYSVEEVDAFLATADQRTPDEVRNIQFHSRQGRKGYDMDDVDRYLDDLRERRVREQNSKSDTPPA